MMKFDLDFSLHSHHATLLPHYCTISTVSSVTRNSHKKSPRFKSLEFKTKFIGHLGQQIFRIRELTVEMVQYWQKDTLSFVRKPLFQYPSCKIRPRTNSLSSGHWIPGT